MGNTVTVGKNIVIVYDGSPEAFNSTTYFSDEVLLSGIEINGNGSEMKILVRHGGATGEILSKFSDTSGIGAKDTKFKPKWCKPYIATADCTIPNGGIVILELA